MSYSKTQEHSAVSLDALVDDLIGLIAERLALKDKSHLAMTNKKIKNAVYNSSFFLPTRLQPILFKEAINGHMRYQAIDPEINYNLRAVPNYFNTMSWDIESRILSLAIPSGSAGLVTGLLSIFLANYYELNQDNISQYFLYGTVLASIYLCFLYQLYLYTHDNNANALGNNLSQANYIFIVIALLIIAGLVGGCSSALTYALGGDMALAMVASLLSMTLCMLPALKANNTTTLVSTSSITGFLSGSQLSILSSILASFLYEFTKGNFPKNLDASVSIALITGPSAGACANLALLFLDYCGERYFAKNKERVIELRKEKEELANLFSLT